METSRNRGAALETFPLLSSASKVHEDAIVFASRLAEEFKIRFGRRPRLFRAPGRVNLIGDHTDYNGGFVFPAAIDRATYIAVSPRHDGRLRASSMSVPGTLDIRVGEWRRSGNWTDFVTGVAALLGIQVGADLLVDSEVPIGGGLSSSAALAVSVALALGAGERPRADIARICQRAENEFTGVLSGIMDPLTSCLAVAAHLLCIDCRDLSHRTVPLPPNVRLVVANTMVKHELAGTAYNQRRAECESAAARLRVPFLRDVDIGPLVGVELRRARHVISENSRVLQCEAALLAGDLSTAGRLMDESHWSLQRDFEVSCPELDTMARIARELDGVYGARMTGGASAGAQ